MAKRKSFSINSSLSKGLEETINAAHDYSGELFVDVVPLTRIELDPDNPRDLHLSFSDIIDGVDAQDSLVEIKKLELESLQTLAKSINNQGLINPVVVYKFGDNYRLVAGERRTLASLLAGKKSIEARILESKPDPLKRTILQWMENSEREDLKLYERLANINSILEAYAAESMKPIGRVTAAELSDLIGISGSQASQYKVVLQSSDELKEAIQANKVANLDKAAFIAKASFSQQPMLITLCEQGANLKEMKKSIDSVTIHTQQNDSSRADSQFRVAVKNEAAARLIIDSLLSHEKCGHLKNQFSFDSSLTSAELTRLFNRLMKVLDKELSKATAI